MSDSRIDYRSTADALTDEVATARSLGTWAILCLVWLVGLGVWAVYLAAIAFGVLRLFA